MEEQLKTAQTYAAVLVSTTDEIADLRAKLKEHEGRLYELESALLDSLPDDYVVTYKAGKKAVTVVKKHAVPSKIFVADLVG